MPVVQLFLAPLGGGSEWGHYGVKEIYMQKKKIPNEDKNETLGSLENSSSGLRATWLPASFFSPMTTPMSTSDTPG